MTEGHRHVAANRIPLLGGPMLLTIILSNGGFGKSGFMGFGRLGDRGAHEYTSNLINYLRFCGMSRDESRREVGNNFLCR
jgi:hypothetical protein